MKKSIFTLGTVILFLLLLAGCNNEPREVKIKIIGTTDVHGSFYPYDFIKGTKRAGSLARVSTYLKKQREEYGEENVVYVDCGDILQGQPVVYYFNFIDTLSTHLAAAMPNYLGCAVSTIGNHDIEAGHPVYERWVNSCDFPVVCANIIDKSTGEPFLKPYFVQTIDGVKIAYLGMTTPTVTHWVSEEKWKGLAFEDIETSAARWIKIIQEKEKPHIIVGLFHTGYSGGIVTDVDCENAAFATANNVDGFDAIIYGHDHQLLCERVHNMYGHDTYLINPGQGAFSVATLEFSITMKGRQLLNKEVMVRPVSMAAFDTDSLFLNEFSWQEKAVNDYVSRKIGYNTTKLSSREAFFGPCAFVDCIHEVQLAVTGADISFTAPLAFNSVIDAGDLSVRDMFSLYAYENQLCTLQMTGKQVKDYLEMSYSLWSNTMKSAKDHLLLLEDASATKKLRLKYPYYFFDSAAGIRYEVDVTKPQGEKIQIFSMTNGEPFSFEKVYKVALNSYRAGGGGELLTKGAGFTMEELRKNVTNVGAKDLRSIIIDYISKQDTVSPKSLDLWKFVPEKWTNAASQRDYSAFFGSTKNKY